MPPAVSRHYDPILIELQAIVAQVRTYERRAGRPAARVTVALPSHLFTLVTVDEATGYLVRHISETVPVSVEVLRTERGPARVVTVDFELPTAVDPHRKTP